MKKKYKRLLKALEPFISEDMEGHCRQHTGTAIVRLEVSGRNRYALSRSLAQLRTLWETYREVRDEGKNT